ncbi:glycosyl transferase [Synechococcus sp. PCC 7502]|uniref:glycosyltransferase family 2 protein n=1 Tax=Synechococcus sp. PCC 7502 TaxID=1173263 RepID=UPI00029FD2AB|nr:glycosyltransferase [Synechococcus sp. PCC 7502]AFY74465.1 glycosyl transferase [Synechococcus sp. PCC 7502]
MINLLKKYYMVLFSVVIPVFNRDSLIQKTIDSILNQSNDNYEIIIVDDGSTDNTIDILIKYGSRIKVFTQQNQGPGKARNLGIKNSQGEYIAFLDSDDIWFPWTLKVYEKVIRETNKPAFLAGNSIFFNNEKEIDYDQVSQLNFTAYKDFYASNKNANPFLTSSVTIRRDILEEVGGFTDQWINSEDNDLWLRLGIAKGFVYINSPAVLAYRQHPQSAIALTEKTYDGTCYLVKQEKQDQYPGGKIREKERLQILTRHIRPVSLRCLQEGEIKNAWQLYTATFRWHLSLSRFRYLIVFLCLTLLSLIKLYNRTK